MTLNLFEVILDIERSSFKFLESRSLRSSNYSVFEIWSKTLNKSILKNIVKIIKISHLIFNRYRDEYEKTVDNPENRDDSLVESLNHNMDFSLKLLLLMKIHREYLLEYTENYDKAQVSATIISFEEYYRDLHTFYFNYSEMNLDLNIAKLFQRIEEQNSNDRLTHQLDEIDNIGSEIELKIKLSQGRFYLQTLSDLVRSLRDDYWYEDLLISIFLNNKAIDKLSSLSNTRLNVDSIELSAELEKVLQIEIPSAKAQSEYSNAKFKVKVAKLRINSFELPEANIELKSALGSLEKVFNELGMNPKSNRMKSIQKEAIALSEQTNLLNLLVELNLAYNRLVESLTNDEKSEVNRILDEIGSLLNSHDFNLDIEYLSALPAIYDNIVNVSTILIQSNSNLDKLREQIGSNFENMERRIITATNQIVEHFTDLSDDNKQETRNQIQQLLSQIKILQLTNSLLPSTIPSRNHNHNRLKILTHLAKSFDFELQAFFVSDMNKIKELIFKTKAYHHANTAYFEFNNLGTQDVPINRIKAHYSGSFISSNRLQIQLYQSIAQYLCLNEVLPSFYLVLSFDGDLDQDPQQIYTSWKKRMDSLDLFENILKQIVHGSQILREHQQIHGSIVSGINWEQVELIEYIAKGNTQFLNSLKELILGTIALKLDLKEDSIIHFTEAKTIAFSASETLQHLGNTSLDVKEAPTLIYNFAKFCQNSAANPESHNLMDIPITAAFKLFRDLVFSL